MSNNVRDKQTLEALAGDALLRMKELALLTGERQSTLKYYADIGILPNKQIDEGLTRRFNKKATLARLKEIELLKQKGFTIQQLIDKFGKTQDKVLIK